MKLANYISKRDVVKFLGVAHMLKIDPEPSQDEYADIQVIAELAADIVAECSKIDSWTKTFPN